MNNYTQLNVNYFNETSSDVVLNKTLSLNNTNVYFGMKDVDNNYKNKLTENTYSFDTDTTGCSASATLQNGGDSNTALLIKYNLSATSSIRVISFKYNSTPMFYIIQGGYFTYVSLLNKIDSKYSKIYFIYDDNISNYQTISRNDIPPSYTWDNPNEPKLLYFIPDLSQNSTLSKKTYNDVKNKLIFFNNYNTCLYNSSVVFAQCSNEVYNLNFTNIKLTRNSLNIGIYGMVDSKNLKLLQVIDFTNTRTSGIYYYQLL